MIIGLQTNSLPLRGTDRAIRDYSEGLALLGHTPKVFIPAACEINQASWQSIKQFADIKVYMPSDLEEVTSSLDACYTLKFGHPSSETFGCNLLVHAVFDASSPHGHRYAAVSEWLALDSGCKSWVPHIVKPPQGRSIRAELGIPENAFVVGYHGGEDSFDLGFVQTTLENALNQRKDLYAIFMGVNVFSVHSRTRFLRRSGDVGNFIASCDAMLHARSRGETFGLSVAEFASNGKPILSWAGSREKAHFHHLENDSGLIKYNSNNDLLEVLLNIQKNEFSCDPSTWDQFSLPNVMTKFTQEFLV